MIQQLTIIDTFSEKLQDPLPRGHVIDTNHQLVLLVGENGTGKTGLLRYLNSSIDAHNYWRIYHRGKIWSFFNQNIAPNAEEELSYKK